MNPPAVRRFHSREYFLSAVLALSAVALTAALRDFFGGSAVLPLVTVAITLAASFGGLGPGILTTTLSVICLGFLFERSWFVAGTNEPSLWLVGGLGVAISLIVDYFCRRNRAVLAAKDLLEIANKKLALRSELLTLSNEELKRFVYALSHDLKTPLRTVSLFSEQLAGELGDQIDPDAQTSLRFIREGARQAQAMIRRLLEYAMAVNQDGVEGMTDLGSVLASALDDLKFAAQDAGARITAGELPVVPGDEGALRQLFLNLVANAIKYRGARPLEVHISARPAGERWIVSVRDNGIGIDSRYSDKVFELFERLHTSSEYDGSGIGLAICRRIVQRHGGRIWVESEPGQGSTFCFTLPVQETKQSPLVSQLAGPPEAVLTRL
jgi:signal transduction histidine kinase